jgi:hypothetical protein
MKSLLLAVVALSGCSSFSNSPVLYDGSRHVVIYCDQAREHAQYLEHEIANSKNADFIRETKTMLWNIRFSCPSNI